MFGWVKKKVPLKFTDLIKQFLEVTSVKFINKKKKKLFY